MTQYERLKLMCSERFWDLVMRSVEEYDKQLLSALFNEVNDCSKLSDLEIDYYYGDHIGWAVDAVKPWLFVDLAEKKWSRPIRESGKFPSRGVEYVKLALQHALDSEIMSNEDRALLNKALGLDRDAVKN